MKQTPLCTDFWWNNKVCAWLHASSVRVVVSVLDLVNSDTLKHRLQVNSLHTSGVKRSYLEESIGTNLFASWESLLEQCSGLTRGCVCRLGGTSARMWLECRSFPCSHLMRSTVTLSCPESCHSTVLAVPLWQLVQLLEAVSWVLWKWNRIFPHSLL